MSLLKRLKEVIADKKVVFITIAVIVLVCIISAITVMASMVSVTVIDGDKTVSFEISGFDEEKILDRAASYGIEPLEGYDEAIFDENNDTLTIYRQVKASVTDNDMDYEFFMAGRGISKDAILNEAQIRCGIKPCNTDDIVTYSESENKVTIVRAINFTFVNCGKESKARLYFGDTVGDLLKMNKITVKYNDELSHTPDTLVYDGMRVVYSSICKFTVTVDGETKSYTCNADIVEKILKQIGIELSEDDIVNVDLDESLENEMEIVIQRVKYVEKEEKEEIPFEIEEVETDSLYIGESEIETRGQEGKRLVKKRIKMIDGKADSEEELSSEVIEEPVTQIVLVGTKERYVLDYNGNKLYFSRVLTGTCTAYTGGGRTATGVPAAYGYIAVNPNVIPYGTSVYIEAVDGSFVYGTAVAADTGGAFMSGDFLADLYFDTESECYSFGMREMNIYILE